MTKRARLTLLAALRDPQLLGALPAFRDLSSWGPWLTLLAAAYGLPLTDAEAETFRRYTGRSAYAPPPGGWREVVCIVGRQSGKSRIAALIAAYEAAVAAPSPDRTERYAVLVAQDHRAALRTVLSYVKAPFELAPLLAQTVSGRTTETLALTTRVTLAAYPCRPAAVRGLRAVVAVCDELAFFRSSENLPTDTEMLRALRPCLATTGGKLIILSSPYGQTGALWELHRQHYGREDSPVLVWQASAPDMNPTLPADYLDRMAQDDPEAYRSEVLGEFRAGLATFLDPEVLEAAVDRGVRERPPVASVRYTAFVDPSGGRGDAFTLAIGHRHEETVLLDALRRWPPPFNPSGVIAEIADLVRAYRCDTVTGDKYAGEFCAEQFRVHHVSYRSSERDRSALYLELLPVLQAGGLRLLDDAVLLRELRGLERRRGMSGKDRVDHRPGAHDDSANAVAGVVSRLAARSWSGETVMEAYRLLASPTGEDLLAIDHPGRAAARGAPTCAGCGGTLQPGVTYTEVGARAYHPRCAPGWAQGR